MKLRNSKIVMSEMSELGSESEREDIVTDMVDEDEVEGELKGEKEKGNTS